jgi:hypothetical protein
MPQYFEPDASKSPTDIPGTGKSYYLVAKYTNTTTSPTGVATAHWKLKLSYKNSFGVLRHIEYNLSAIKGQEGNVASWNFDASYYTQTSMFPICVSEIVSITNGDVLKSYYSCTGD